MVEETTETINEETKEEPKVKVPEFKKPLDKMTAIELREVAMEIPGVTGAHAMKKEELLPIIKEYYGIEDETAGKGKKKVEKVAATVHELKTKMTQLKEKRKEVRAAKDRKQTDILRRRINRLKRKTRKGAQV
jgi:outer membrane murein-binding lipoprotein Lpp